MINKFNRLLHILKCYSLELRYGGNVNIQRKRKTTFGCHNIIKLSSKNAKLITRGKFLSWAFNSFHVDSDGILDIGKNVFLNNYVSINAQELIKIGDNTIVGEGTRFYDHDHIFKKDGLIMAQGFKTAPIQIGNNVWIGANVVILKGTKIGDNSVVGAGVVLQGEYPENSLITGSARDVNCVEIKR